MENFGTTSIILTRGPFIYLGSTLEFWYLSRGWWVINSHPSKIGFKRKLLYINKDVRASINRIKPEALDK